VSRHTFLFDEGQWLASGFLIDARGEHCHVSGDSQIRHADGFWVNESRMKVACEPPFEARHTYRVKPFEAGRDDTTWASENPAVGQFRGTMVIVADTIISRAESSDGVHWTVDAIRRVSPEHYTNRGAYFHEGKRVSSWVIDLRRADQSP